MGFDGLGTHKKTRVMETCRVLLYIVPENYVKCRTPKPCFAPLLLSRGWLALSCLPSMLARHRASIK